MDPMNQAGGSSKKGLYIVMGILVLVVVVFLMTGGFTRSIKMGDNNIEVSSKINSSITKLADNWPSDTPIYPNAKITNYEHFDPDQNNGMEVSRVEFTSSDSAQIVSDFYRKELVSNGWAIGKWGTDTIFGADKDNRNVGINIINLKTGGIAVKVTITINPKK